MEMKATLHGSAFMSPEEKDKGNAVISALVLQSLPHDLAQISYSTCSYCNRVPMRTHGKISLYIFSLDRA